MLFSVLNEMGHTNFKDDWFLLVLLTVRNPSVLLLLVFGTVCGPATRARCRQNRSGNQSHLSVQCRSVLVVSLIFDVVVQKHSQQMGTDDCKTSTDCTLFENDGSERFDWPQQGRQRTSFVMSTDLDNKKRSREKLCFGDFPRLFRRVSRRIPIPTLIPLWPDPTRT